MNRYKPQLIGIAVGVVALLVTVAFLYVSIPGEGRDRPARPGDFAELSFTARPDLGRGAEGQPADVIRFVSDELQPADADRQLQLEAVPNQMRYDQAELTARPGELVALTFINPDNIEHNLLVIRAQSDMTYMDVANLAMAMGPRGIANDWVPDTDEVLFHSVLLGPNQRQTLLFRVPDQPGDYPYVCTMPGHASTMNGVLRVRADAAPQPESQAEAPDATDANANANAEE